LEQRSEIVAWNNSGVKQRLGRKAVWNSGQDEQHGTFSRNSGLKTAWNTAWNKSLEQRPGTRHKTAARNIGPRAAGARLGMATCNAIYIGLE
jgi:hypothetical protein